MKDIWESLPLNVIDSDRKKYIYGISIESLSVFLMALNENVYVEAFVSCLAFDSVMNKKVILMEEIPKGAELLIPDNLAGEVDEKKLKNKVDMVKIKVHTISEKLKQQTAYIFGAGGHGKSTQEKLIKNDVEIKGFIDSDKAKQGKHVNNILVYSLNCVDEIENIVISSYSYKEIFRDLVNRGYKNVYVDYGIIYGKDYPYAILHDEDNELDILWSLQWHFHILLRDVILKKIIIYGYNSLGQELKRILYLMDKDILYFVGSKGLNVSRINYKDVADIVKEDMTDKMILVTEFEKGRCPKLLELESKGLKYNADFKDIHVMSDNSIRDSRFGKYGCELDPMLGFTFRYPETSDIYDQYVVLGDAGEKDFRIMILGNSTSDIGEYKPEKSWPEYLYELIGRKNVTIFGGANGAYSARQECLKLLRDIGTIRPSIVISYSGVVDASPMEVSMHPFLSTRQISAMEKLSSEYRINKGIVNAESVGNLWFRMEITMKEICRLCGCKFFGIFQPIFYDKKVLVGREKAILLYNLNKYAGGGLEQVGMQYRAIKKEVVDAASFQMSDSLFDFSGLFANSTEEIFKDGVHLYEKGNKYVAEEILKIIKPSLEYLNL